VILHTRDKDGQLFRPPRLASTKHLNWAAWVRWQRWKLAHPPKPARRPRATWAQVLRAFGFNDAKTLISRLIDADSIPSYFDMPIQRIKLFDIGILAHCMAFTTVEINVANRNFKASGPFGTITTEDVPNFGKALRFEGDMFAICSTVRRCTAAEMFISCIYLNGKMLFGRLRASGLVLPLQLLTTAVMQTWSTEKMQKEMSEVLNQETDESILVGHLPREGSEMKTYLADILKDQMSIFLGPRPVVCYIT
jgi:hypothetical protein